MAGTLFFSSLMTETNSFSNIPTGYGDFEAEGIKRGNEIFYDADEIAYQEVEPILAFAEERSLKPIGGIAASAAPGAPVQHQDYLQLKEELIGSLQAADKVEAVFLTLHGAMMSTECDDCEGDILKGVRAVVGPMVPVGVVLDPHAHLTDEMIRHADLMAFMKEYPHTDGIERSQEILSLMGRLLDDKIKPIAAVYDCHLMGFFPTQESPMRDFVDRMFWAEQADEILSISFVHGFPWGDMQDAGAKLLVYSDDNPVAGQTLAEKLGRNIWSIKDETMPPLISIEEAIEKTIACEHGPVILSDIADNPGGGAPSDATHILEAIISSSYIEPDLTNIAIGLIYDPEAVKACHKVGPGGYLDLRLGGKISQFSGSPLDLEIDVRAVRKNARMDFMGITDFPMGDTAWVHTRGIDIVLSSVREQMYAPSGFSHIGIDPSQKRALIVKSSNHFRAAFEEISKDIFYVSTAGAIDFDFARLPYKKLNKPFYPAVQDPFSNAL